MPSLRAISAVRAAASARLELSTVQFFPDGIAFEGIAFDGIGFVGTTVAAQAFTYLRPIRLDWRQRRRPSGSNDEPQLAGGGLEAIVEADERALSRTLATPDERCGELGGVGGPQSVRVR